MSKKHRGRIQAQGNNLEKSVFWSQDDPLTKEDGLSLLEQLKEKLTKREMEEREREIKKAKRFIENSQGGLDAVKKKTFLKAGTRDTRIDIEILSGIAFISFLLILILLIAT